MFIKLGSNATFAPDGVGGGGDDDSDTFTAISKLIDDNDEPDAGDDDTSTSAEGADGQTQTNADGTPRGQQRQSDQQQVGKRNQQDTKGQQQQRQQQQDRIDTSPAKPGDLVDPTTRQVIARAGVERRMYERAMERLRPTFEQVRGSAQQTQQKLQAATAKLQGLEQANASLQQIGLSPTDLSQAATLWNALKKSPTETIKHLLARAKASGHNIEVAGGAAGIDMSAIEQMISNKMKPLLDEHGQRANNTRAQQEAVNEGNAFLARYPDARIHSNVIADLMAKDTTLTPREAYLLAKSWAVENRLDWSRPLIPQMQGGGGQQQQQQQQQRHRPSGRVTQIENGEDVNGAEQFDVDASWDDVVRRTMQANGIRVRG